MNISRFLESPGTRLGGLIDGLIFAAMLAVWYAMEQQPAGTHTADTGAMTLLIPFVILFSLAFCAVLSVGSSLLGAFAGYWAARMRSPLVGAMAGLLAGTVGASILVVLFPASSSDTSLLGVWLLRLKWLVPPAAIAGIVVGLVEMKRAR